LAILRQAIPVAPAGAAQGAGGGGVPGGAVPAGAALGGGAEVPLPVNGLSLMQWMGMKLDTFDDSGTPIEAPDYVWGSCLFWHAAVEGGGSNLVERRVGAHSSSLGILT
jgi:hypothetical protein